MKDPYGAFHADIELRIAGAAGGPLAGLTFAAKDVFDVAGHVTGNGHPLWRATHARAAETAAALRALLAAGASLVGRTVNDELCHSLVGHNGHYGMPVNPRTPDRVPGGSSSGSACAVAGGLVDFAPATDCGGSVRVPASFCGLYGMRPTHGRVSAAGVVPLAPGFDTVGWLARGPALLETVGRVLLADCRDARAPRRLLVADDLYGTLPPPARRAMRRLVGVVERTLGLAAAPVAVAPEGPAHWVRAFRTLQGAELWANHGGWVTANRPLLEPAIATRLDFAASIGTGEVQAWSARRRDFARRLADMLADDAVLCLPTAGVAPRRTADADELERYRAATLALTGPAGLAGTPQVHLPLGEVDGCPVGISLMAARGGDEMLLALARRIGKQGREK